MLVHHPDPLRDRVARAVQADGPAADPDLPAVRLEQPVKDVHQGRLAGPVLTHQGVDLPLAHLEVDVIVGHHAGPGLHDLAHVDCERGLVPRLLGHSVPGA